MSDPVICPICDGEINRSKKGVKCTSCNKKVHTACATNLPKLNTGAFAFCCGSLSKSRRSLGPPALSPMITRNRQQSGAVSKQPLTKDDLDQALENWYKKFETSLEAKISDAVQKSLTNITGRITLLEEKLNLLENQLQAGGRSTSSTPSTDKETLLSEFENRRSHAKNVIVYNLKPIDGKNDVTTFCDFVRVVVEFPPPSSSFRFGKSFEGRPRPLKLICSSEDEARNILRRRTALSNLGILVKNDLTLDQRKHLTAVREELKRRSDGGEPNLTIKFQNGAPVIVTISKNM